MYELHTLHVTSHPGQRLIVNHMHAGMVISVKTSDSYPRSLCFVLLPFHRRRPDACYKRSAPSGLVTQLISILYSRIILIKSATYNSQNYAGTLGSSLPVFSCHAVTYEFLVLPCIQFVPSCLNGSSMHLSPKIVFRLSQHIDSWYLI